MTVVLGIDLGLTGARAALVDDRCRIIGRGRAAMASATPGRVQAQDWRKAVAAAVRAACADGAAPAIEAIGIGALGPCPVLLDETGTAQGDVPLFSTDNSAEPERLAMLQAHGCPPEALGPDHVLPRLRHWKRTQPEMLDRARLVVDAAGYLALWLTDRPVIDPATRHDHVAEGIAPIVPLPETLSATAIAGYLTRNAAAEIGLPAGIPVTAGGYDSYVDLFGAGVRADGDAGLLLGSTMVLGRVCDEPPDMKVLASAGLRVTPYIGETYFAGGWTSSSGSLLDWTRMVATTTPTESLSLPGHHGLLALPYFAGERAPVWDPYARGAIVGATLTTTPVEMATALREAVALSTLDIADRLGTALGATARFRAAGGGVNNQAWAQDTADALGVPIDIVAGAGEAIGPALLALAALGYDIQPAISHTILPAPRRHARYRELLDLYRGLYPALETTMHALGRLASKEDLP